MKKYFKNIETLEQLRKQYKELLKKYHPDNLNGSEAATKQINIEYEELFKALRDKHNTANNTKGNAESAYNKNMYDWENDKELREVLQKIINLSGITINLVGTWIWLEGDTYHYKENLKTIGFKWSGQRKKWYWNNCEYVRRGNNKIAFSEIEKKYGSTKFKAECKELLEA